MANKFRNRNQPPKDWEEIKQRAKSPQHFGWFAICFFVLMVTHFNLWVFFGLTMASMGRLGILQRKTRRQRLYEEGYKDAQLDIYGQMNEQSETSLPEIKPQESPLLHKEILKDAQDEIDQLRAASAVASGELGKHLRNMVKNTERAVQSLNADPAKLSQIQRLFTYYLPATCDILKARAKAAIADDVVKIAEIDAMIERLDGAFSEFADRLNGEDLRSINIDMKLLDQSLASEFDILKK